MSKIKSIKFRIFSLFISLRMHPSFLLSGEEQGETVEFAARNYLCSFYTVLFYFPSAVTVSFFIVINR